MAKASKTQTPAHSSAARRSSANPRPRGGREFDFSKHSRPKSRAPKDDKTIRADAPQIELVRPAWTGSTGTTVRPLPCFDIHIEDQDVFAHSRKEPKEWFFNDWIRGYRCVKYVGIDQKLTFAICDPRDTEYDMNTNPYMVLYRAIMDATKQGEAYIGQKRVIDEKWFPLTNRDSPKCAFNSPTDLYFMQGLIYQHNGEVTISGGKPRGAKDKDLPQIIQMSKTAGEDLMEALNEFREDGQGDGFDAFKIPDITSLTDGWYVTIYNPDKHPTPGQSSASAPQEGQTVQEEEYSEESASDKKGRNREFKGWKAHCSDEFLYTKDGSTYRAKRDLSPLEDKIRENVLWFDNVLRVPTMEETAAFCATAYRSMPVLLDFAWQDHPEFFTDEVKGILRARTSGEGVEVPSIGDEDEDEVVGDEPVGPSTSAALPDMSVEEEVPPAEEADEEAALAAAEKAAARARKRREGGDEEPAPKNKRVKKKKVSATNGSAPGKRRKVPKKKAASE
jgi:hypothetical protein